MLRREQIITELVTRIGETSGISFVARNPSAKPSIDEMPLGNLFDFPAKVVKVSGGGKTALPTYKMAMQTLVEIYISGTTEDLASYELIEFYSGMLSAVFSDGNSLGGLCEINITEMTRIFRPPIGGNVAGIGTVFTVVYPEDLNLLSQ